MVPSGRRRAASTCRTAARTGATSSRWTASIPDAFSIRRSSSSSTTRATRKTSSTASTTALPGRFDPLDLNYSRSWFQTPNAYDNLDVQNVMNGGRAAAVQRKPDLRQRRQHRPALQDRHVQYLADITRTSSTTTRSSTWAHSSARTSTTTTPAPTPSPTWDRRTCRPRPSPKTARSPMPPSIRITPTSRASTTSRSARNTGRRSS